MKKIDHLILHKIKNFPEIETRLNKTQR